MNRKKVNSIKPTVGMLVLMILMSFLLMATRKPKEKEPKSEGQTLSETAMSESESGTEVIEPVFSEKYVDTDGNEVYVKKTGEEIVTTVIEWSQDGLAAYLPVPSSDVGVVVVDRDNLYSEYAAHIDETEYKRLVNDAWDNGFCENVTEEKLSYQATNNDGTRRIEFQWSPEVEVCYISVSIL